MATQSAKPKAFTDKAIATLKPESKPYYRREGRGFAVRVLPSGLRTFFYIYTLEGKRQHYKLGHYPETTLAAARLLYQDAYKAVALGQELTVDLLKPEPCVEPVLFKEFALEYIALAENRLCKEWYMKMKACINTDVLPFWGELPITEIRRRAVVLLLERVAKRSPGQTANVHKAIRGVFEYAVEREYLEYNPCLRLTKVVPDLKYTPRSRVLTPKEIKTVWSALNDCASHRALKLILVTAQRPGEVAGMHRREITGGSAPKWTIPQERAEKGRGDHIVPLTQTALEIIGNADGLILGITRGGVSQEVARRLMCCGLPRWTPHDLRRTARTYMAKVGVLDEHAEAVINHAKQGMVKVYNKYEYQAEKQAALLKWEAELLRIVS